MLSCFLLSVSLALFSTSFIVKIFLIDVERYEPLKLRAYSCRTIKAFSKSFETARKDAEEMNWV